jgi:hypothetical protein
MKRKRIQYNELNEEIYAPVYWTKLRLILIGIFLLIFGFLVNFSLEEKINKFLLAKLSNNSSCPIQFEKAELSYIMPKITVQKPVVMGACFGQYSNKLLLNDIKIGFHSPSFAPPGIRLHVSASSGKSYINLYPVISIFSQNVKIEKTVIDTQIFAPLTSNNLSPISGFLSLEGFFEFQSGTITGGELEVVSKNFSIPSQNIKGFELTQLNLETLNLTAHFTDKDNLSIDRIQIGKRDAPIELMMKGNLKVAQGDFMGSRLTLNGNLKLSEYILLNFSFIKLFLPTGNTSGNYEIKLNGPLRSPGAPQIL